MCNLRKLRTDKQAKSAAELWLNHPDRRSYEGVTFNPNGASDGYYNLFQGFSVAPAQGDCGLYLDHTQSNICKGDEELYSCLGGLGGCPFAPGASGNVNTEDTVGMFHSMGIDTGVDIEKLIEVRRLLETWLPNEKLGGNLIKTF